MKIIILDSENDIAKAVSKEFIDQISNKKDSVLGLATGSSPIDTYKELIKAYDNNMVSFKSVTTYNLDEYYGLNRKSPHSYYSFMRKNLFDKVDMRLENVHVLDGMAKDEEKECRYFEESIKNKGGIDLQLLGIGTNAHIGFNEPADAFSTTTYKVKLAKSTLIANGPLFGADEMPLYALTMGMEAIMNAKKIILIAMGKGKAQAMKDTIEGKITPLVPASILQNHRNVTIYMDKAAATLLK